MTSQQQQPPYDPPRLPLRVHVSVHGQFGDGSAIVATAWRTLEPHEPEYELAYQEAARAYRISDWDMPYADGDVGEPEEGHPAGGESLEADMIDTAGDTLAADTAESEAMSQSFEEDERVWQGIHANDAAPLPEREDAERTRRRQLPLADSLREAIATSRTLLDHAEQT